MSYARACANLIMDNANADGMLSTFACGRDWNAMEKRDDQPAGFTPDVAGQYGWNYDGRFEYIDRLGCIAPVGTYTAANMSLSDWFQVKGMWRATGGAAGLRTTFLHYYDGRANRYAANAYGVLRSVASHNPNLMFWFWRLQPNWAETDAPLIEIRFLGTGGTQYAITLPAFRSSDSYFTEVHGTTDRDQLHPELLGRPTSEALWSVVDSISAGSSPTMQSAGHANQMEVVRVEYLDGTIMVRMGENDNAWAFSGPWKTSQGKEINFAMEAGPIEVRAVGHPMMFAMLPLTYRSGIQLTPTMRFFTASAYEQTANYRVISTEPAGTDIAVTQDADGNWSNPVATFTSTDTSQRAALYCIQEYRNATIAAGVTSTVQTQGNSTFALVNVSGSCNEKWRGASIEAEIEAYPGSILADIRPNAKLAAYVSTNDGLSSTQMFTGYVTPPEKTRVPGPMDNIRGALRADDIIEARLRKKCMHFLCSFEGNGGTSGWTVASAFEYLLHCAGVPDALISVDAGVTAAAIGPSFYLPGGTNKGGRKFKFGPETDFVSALDTIVGAVGMPSSVNALKRRGLRWGVNSTGVVFLEPDWEHTAGAYDYTLDEDDADIEDVCVEFKSTRSLADFANFITVMVGEGIDATAKYYIDPDWNDATKSRFLGDLWHRFVSMPDGTDPEAAVMQLWEELGNRHWMIEFTMHDHPEIMPDWEIRVQTSNLNIANNSIFRVLNKSWQAQASGEYKQTLTAIMVEEGT